VSGGARAAMAVYVCCFLLAAARACWLAARRASPGARGAGGSALMVATLAPPAPPAPRLAFSVGWPCVAYILPLAVNAPEGSPGALEAGSHHGGALSGLGALSGGAPPDPRTQRWPRARPEGSPVSRSPRAPAGARLSTTGLLGCVAAHALAYVLVETGISNAVVREVEDDDGGEGRRAGGARARHGGAARERLGDERSASQSLLEGLEAPPA
jgi:hypothetical protein